MCNGAYVGKRSTSLREFRYHFAFSRSS